MSESWARFVWGLDPNDGATGVLGSGSAGVQGVLWPRYDVGMPMDFVWQANGTSFAEADTYRAAGMALINADSVAYMR